MTWHTPIGRRTLKGAEAELIRESLGYIADMCEEDIKGYTDPWMFEVTLIDRLESSARLALFAEVGFALLRETNECPKLNAVNESAVACLFRNIEQCIQIEIDHQKTDETSRESADADMRVFWRSRVLAVFKEIGDADDLPDTDCKDWNEWLILMDVLNDRILWDADYEDSHLYLDSAPEHAAYLRNFMTIDDDYYLAIPPDPTDAELSRIRKMLNELLQD